MRLQFSWQNTAHVNGGGQGFDSSQTHQTIKRSDYMIYAIIGLDVAGEEMCIFELHEDRERAETFAETYRRNWLQRGTRRGDMHADAIEVIKLAPGFRSYNPLKEQEEEK